jgi:2-polyprenyl-3-methyl-5-hydroxy-6-metoxy-1,4-benzoquinol methylase
MFYISEKDKRKNKIWSILSENIWCNSKILDCASGDGRKGIQYYMQQGVNPNNVIAIDVEMQNLEKLKEVGVRTYCADLEKDDIKILVNDKFDIILCAETLEHLSEKTEKKLLHNFLKMLNLGGHIIITFPNNMVIETPVKKYGHIRQPKSMKIIKKLSPFFEKYKLIRYKKKEKKGNSTSIIVFSKKRER